jgi:dTDP-4-dehydrorhamnose 3,5-epimerase
VRFTQTPIAGAMVVEPQRLADERGFFARTYCAEEFAAHGLSPMIAQANISFNRLRGTLRGMHYQVDPGIETKLIRCTRGAIWDVIIDVRPRSPTYLSQFGVELSDQNRIALYVPGMCAHGFQTLVDETEVSYQVGDFYRPGHERGIAYDDPAFDIDWPLPVSVISEKDRSWAPYAVPVGART